jgi:hypothetical protein
MKVISLSIAAIAFVTLAACDPKPNVPELPQAPSAPSGPATGAPTPPPPATAGKPDAPTKPEDNSGGLPLAKLGEMCGGFAGIQCQKGLVCGNVMPVADGSGTCRKANP